MRIEFHPLASEEIVEAAYWYESQSPGLSDQFLRELQNAVDAIAEFPYSWPKVLRDTRRKPMHKFPYYLFYKVYEVRIVVYAVGHQSRRPNYWADRG